MTYSVQPIVLNGIISPKMEISPSAMKHWFTKSVKIYEYIHSSLDGQYREEEVIDSYGNFGYALASATGINPYAPWAIAKFRDTYFHFYEETGTVFFFHGCPRDANWFRKQPYRRKIRSENLL